MTVPDHIAGSLTIDELSNRLQDHSEASVRRIAQYILDEHDQAQSAAYLEAELREMRRATDKALRIVQAFRRSKDIAGDDQWDELENLLENA